MKERLKNYQKHFCILFDESLLYIMKLTYYEGLSNSEWRILSLNTNSLLKNIKKIIPWLISHKSILNELSCAFKLLHMERSCTSVFSP